MPIYEYECASCGYKFERMQKITETPMSNCPSCGKNGLRKLFSPSAIQFKGSGWYVTDYAKKGSSEDRKFSEEKKKDAAKADTTPDSGKKDQ